jgi:hypothetical protein
MWPAMGVVVVSFVVLLFRAFGVVRLSGFPINWIIYPLLNEKPGRLR